MMDYKWGIRSSPRESSLSKTALCISHQAVMTKKGGISCNMKTKIWCEHTKKFLFEPCQLPSFQKSVTFIPSQL